MLQPIPLKALIHSVVHSKVSSTSRGKNYGIPVSLNNVLVQDKTIRQNTTSGYSVVNGALMFWDATYSTDCDFSVGDMITFNGVDRFIIDIMDATTTHGIHHKELTLL